MGLDMYMTARHSFYGCNITATVCSEDYNGVKRENKIDNVRCVETEVGYWRKANAIHKWFVDNVQNGEDDCKKYYVSEDDLDALELACRKVLAAKGTEKEKEVAMEFLPPCDGFFFGGTEIDEYYFTDLEDTLKIIERARKALLEKGDIYYSSSW